MAAAGTGLAEGGSGGTEEVAEFPPVRIEGIELEASGEGGGQQQGAVRAAGQQRPGRSHDPRGKYRRAVELSVAGEDLVEFREGSCRADTAEGGQPGLEDVEPVDLA